MRKVVIILMCILIQNSIFAQNETQSQFPSLLRDEVNVLQSNQETLKREVSTLISKNTKATAQINRLDSANKELNIKIDSLQRAYNELAVNQKTDKSELSTSIDKTNEKVQATEANLSSRTLWGVGGLVVLILTLIAVVCAFLKIKSGSSSIGEIKKAQSSMEDAQEQMRKAQEKMQEESVKLDNKLIEVLSKQPVPEPSTNEDGEVDHSLALKVADEIVRIETNLSRMDSSIKGYKQLAKGVQRIKDNFKANDYEIVDMLGKPYQAGMKAAVTFVTDENLEPGQQIISRIIKPQVNYKQKMIQAAQIEVSQAED